MSASVSKLRLGPLPRHETVKLTIAMTAVLRDELERYATLHAQTYGESVDAVTLIPHMLEAFIARDRAFKKQPAAEPDASTRRLTANGSIDTIGADVLPVDGTKK